MRCKPSVLRVVAIASCVLPLSYAVSSLLSTGVPGNTPPRMSLPDDGHLYKHVSHRWLAYHRVTLRPASPEGSEYPVDGSYQTIVRAVARGEHLTDQPLSVIYAAAWGWSGCAVVGYEVCGRAIAEQRDMTDIRLWGGRTIQVPLRPTPWLVVDWLGAVVAVWIVVLTQRLVTARIRRWRGLCPNCGYPGDVGRCPECGEQCDG